MRGWVGGVSMGERVGEETLGCNIWGQGVEEQRPRATGDLSNIWLCEFVIKV